MTGVSYIRFIQPFRYLREHGFEEGVSTRLLIYAGRLMRKGISPRRACDVAITALLTDEKEVQRAVNEVVAAVFP